MPPHQKLFEQIDSLSDDARKRLVIKLLKSLRWWPRFWFDHSPLDVYSSIVSTPNVCGGAARIVRTRIPVWTLERMRQLGLTESEILRSYPTLCASDLVQAWAYVAHHHEEIEQVISENEDGDENGAFVGSAVRTILET